MLPFVHIFGDVGPQRRCSLNLRASRPILYLAAGQIAWIVFRSWNGRACSAIVLVATMPLARRPLPQQSSRTSSWSTLATGRAILLLLMTRGLRATRGLCVGLGVAMGLGTLTKVTFPVFMLGPLAGRPRPGRPRPPLGGDGHEDRLARPDLREACRSTPAAPLLVYAGRHRPLVRDQLPGDARLRPLDHLRAALGRRRAGTTP